MTVAVNSEIHFGAEFVSDSWSEALPLMKAHWDEIEQYKEIPLDPDFEIYKKLDEAQVLRVFTARDSESKLVGYCVYIVQVNPLTKGITMANQNALFVKKENRGFGKKFIAWCDDMLRKEGINFVYHHVSPQHDYSPILRRLGYKSSYQVYSRRLV